MLPTCQYRDCRVFEKTVPRELTLCIFDVWAVTAAKGVWSDSMLSIAIDCSARRKGGLVCGRGETAKTTDGRRSKSCVAWELSLIHI